MASILFWYAIAQKSWSYVKVNNICLLWKNNISGHLFPIILLLGGVGEAEEGITKIKSDISHLPLVFLFNIFFSVLPSPCCSNFLTEFWSMKEVLCSLFFNTQVLKLVYYSLLKDYLCLVQSRKECVIKKMWMKLGRGGLIFSHWDWMGRV